MIQPVLDGLKGLEQETAKRLDKSSNSFLPDF